MNGCSPLQRVSRKVPEGYPKPPRLRDVTRRRCGLRNDELDRATTLGATRNSSDNVRGCHHKISWLFAGQAQDVVVITVARASFPTPRKSNRRLVVKGDPSGDWTKA